MSFIFIVAKILPKILLNGHKMLKKPYRHLKDHYLIIFQKNFLFVWTLRHIRHPVRSMAILTLISKMP